MPSLPPIGKFELLEELGKGGMGVVYKAWDTELTRTVAIKKLTLVTEEYLERFKIEARAAARLTHPNITTVFDFGVHEGEPYIVMEFLDGQSLRTLIRDRLLQSLEDKVDPLRQTCLALDFAHAQGVAAHRDIKPANIQVTSSGLVKLMDFGIAKLADEIQMVRNLTQANTVLGTLYYMSPEQVKGEKLDGRSDIWSVGVVLYETLYGLRPFDHDEEDVVMKMIVLEDLAAPPPLGLPEEDELQRILLKALEKDRSRRYATAREMATDLGRWLRAVSASDSFPALKREKPAEAWFEEGRGHYGEGRYLRAIDCFRKVLEIRPGHPASLSNIDICERAEQKRRSEELYRLGMLLFKNKEYGVAIKALEELLLLEPANQDARTLINWARAAVTKKEERATNLRDLVADALAAIVVDDEPSGAGLGPPAGAAPPPPGAAPPPPPAKPEKLATFSGRRRPIEDDDTAGRTPLELELRDRTTGKVRIKPEGE